MKTPLLLLLLFVSASAFLPLSGGPLKVYYVTRAAESVSPENMTSPALWKDVPPSGDFIRFMKPGSPCRKTFFQALYNRTWLIFRVTCFEENAAEFALPGVPAARDTAGVLKRPRLEFFLDTDFTRKKSAHAVVNIDGAVFDRIAGDNGWNLDIRTRVERGGNFWTMFAAFPWIDRGMEDVFGMYPHTNPVMGFNLCRERGLEPEEASQWAETTLWAYDRPHEFGALVMSGEKEIGTIAAQAFSGDTAAGGIELYGATGDPSAVYRAALGRAFGDAEKCVRAASGSLRKELDAKLSLLRKKASGTRDPAALKSLLAEVSAFSAEARSKTSRDIAESLDGEI